ncbi:MAG: VWA domain-containing protein [Candidatus Aenigmatarchaeota archaeon]
MKLKHFIAVLMIGIISLGSTASAAFAEDTLTTTCGYYDENGDWHDGGCDSPLMDVVIVVDSTGSMSDEITLVKANLENLVEEIASGNPRPDVRFGIVTYRDHPPEDKTYVYKKLDLTHDVVIVTDYIRSISANGGGDGPEAVADSMHVALDMDWRPDARKIVYLVGDAPPHGLNQDEPCPDGFDYMEEISRAQAMEITFYTIGASGIDGYARGEDVFKEIAELTGGEYERLTYTYMPAEEYYEEKGLDEKEIEIIEADASVYDRETGEALVSTLPSLMAGSMKAEATALGVVYDDVVDDTTDDTKDDGTVVDKKPKKMHFNPIADFLNWLFSIFG